MFSMPLYVQYAQLHCARHQLHPTCAALPPTCTHQQCPQPMSKAVTTRSPFFRERTPGPTSSTTPLQGGGRDTFIHHYCVSAKYRSREAARKEAHEAGTARAGGREPRPRRWVGWKARRHCAPGSAGKHGPTPQTKCLKQPHINSWPSKSPRCNRC